MILLCRAEQVALNFHLFSKILCQKGYFKPPSIDKKDEHDNTQLFECFHDFSIKNSSLWHDECIFCDSERFCFLQTRRPVFIRPQMCKVYSISRRNKKFYWQLYLIFC